MSVEDELLEFVGSGKHRRGCLRLLTGGGMTPGELSQRMEVNISQASRTLRELEEKELVRCTTPRSTKGRIYELTEEGRKVEHRLIRFLRTDFLEDLIGRLDDKGVPYGKNMRLGGKIAELRPDLTVLTDGRTSLALEFRSGEVISGPSAMPSFWRGVRSLAFRTHDVKKESDVEVALIFFDVDRMGIDEGIKDELEGFAEEGYFDHIFFEDEVGEIVEAAGEKSSARRS